MANVQTPLPPANISLLVLSAFAGPKGFVPVRDTQDGYSFLYPFGWQVRQGAAGD